MIRLLAICLFFLLPCLGSGQEGAQTEQQLEALGEALEEELEDDTYLQQLAYLARHPLNLNAAGAEDLQVLRMLTPLQVQSLLQHRRLLGPLIDLHELQALPHWDLVTISRVLPFVTLSNTAAESLATRLMQGEHSLLLRHSRLLQRQRGYDRSRNTHYAGSADKLLFRYRYQYKNNLQYGLVLEKDAGEPLFKTFKNPFDFSSFHMYGRGSGWVKAWAVGDFSINLGQGLVQWQSLAFKKSSEPLAVVRQSAVIRPYSGAGEFYFSRGAAATFGKGPWEATLFATRRKLSANTDSTGGVHITSFSTSGLHRTASERADRNNVTQTGWGGNITYRAGNFKMALNALQHYFSLPIQRRAAPYNLYAISGAKWGNASVDYTYTYKNVFLFGEAATDQKGAKAFVQGALASLHRDVDVALLYRHLPAAYQSLYGNAFTESTLPTNEQGFYAGLVLRPHPAWRLQAYADHYTFPWLRARIHAPGGGADYLVQLHHTPNKRREAYLRYRYERKATNRRDAAMAMNEVYFLPRQTLRLHLAQKMGSGFTARARAEAVFYDAKGRGAERGVLLYAEGTQQFRSRTSANARVQYFSTDGFNSRIYVYESDVLYSYSIPFFADRGWRFYLNGRYNAGKHLTFWLRWAQTTYTNRTSIGSGTELIDGRHRSEIKLQARWLL